MCSISQDKKAGPLAKKSTHVKENMHCTCSATCRTNYTKRRVSKTDIRSNCPIYVHSYSLPDLLGRALALGKFGVHGKSKNNKLGSLCETGTHIIQVYLVLHKDLPLLHLEPDRHEFKVLEDAIVHSEGSSMFIKFNAKFIICVPQSIRDSTRNFQVGTPRIQLLQPNLYYNSLQLCVSWNSCLQIQKSVMLNWHNSIVRVDSKSCMFVKFGWCTFCVPGSKLCMEIMISITATCTGFCILSMHPRRVSSFD